MAKGPVEAARERIQQVQNTKRKKRNLTKLFLKPLFKYLKVDKVISLLLNTEDFITESILSVFLIFLSAECD